MITVRMETLQQIDWTFREFKAKEGIHGLHAYPAMMAPPVARKLIELFSQVGGVVFDPFCGSGTVIAEAIRLNRNAIGFDINPLALLIAEVKSNPLPPKSLWRAYEQIEKALRRNINIEPPRFANIDYWFKPQVQKQLAQLKAAIDEVQDETVRKFCLVVFSRVVREASNTRQGEFKLFRLPAEKLERHNPDAFTLFRQRFSECVGLMSEWWREVGERATKVCLALHDARKPFPIEPESVDLLLTSPPYGDARTTVAYGQFSRLTLQWLGLWSEDLDRIGLGGQMRTMKNIPLSLRDALKNIHDADPKRAREVEAFYADLQDCLFNIVEILKVGGYAIFVVANRKVKGVKLPTDKIVAEILHEFRHVATLMRQIPNKRMPLKNSPSNIAGQTDITMLEEHIVILQKVC
ncbi:MAG: site-specific DNA-methyltransferase [Armatimonadetes bacterium]|nr:site-specific DNA-methyltransferase [Armatimonadota bacterium]MDW8028687.1 DNA methyltransferase [Armatimonadota bacterium]